jgi:hypothetical protein
MTSWIGVVERSGDSAFKARLCNWGGVHGDEPVNGANAHRTYSVRASVPHGVSAPTLRLKRRHWGGDLAGWTWEDVLEIHAERQDFNVDLTDSAGAAGPFTHLIDSVGVARVGNVQATYLRHNPDGGSAAFGYWILDNGVPPPRPIEPPEGATLWHLSFFFDPFPLHVEIFTTARGAIRPWAALLPVR